MRVAYLTNRYPAASHSFIRREIEAVEAQRTEVFRYSVRSVSASELPDLRDKAECAKTVVLLDLGPAVLISRAISAVLFRPLRSLQALKIAFSKNDWRSSTLIKRFAYFVEAATLAKSMHTNQIDHLHAHFGTNSAAVARIASALSGIPYSFTVHGPDEFDAPVQLDLAGKVADSVFCVAISSYGRSQLMRWSDFAHWHKIEVVRCGVDQSFLSTPSDVQIPDVPRICTIARLSAQKGVPLLLEAAAQLKNSGRRFTLSIVGDGEMRREVEAIIARHGLEEHVDLVGWASSEIVIDHLLRSRAMVLPSFAEGLPVVTMEALALERPVIVSTIAGTPELVDADCGWLIPAGSIEKLVEALAAALDMSPHNLAAMGKIGRARVLAHHNSAINGQQLNALFQRSRKIDV